MSLKSHQYALPRQTDGAQLGSRLAAEDVRLREQAPVNAERVFLDSHDWRLYAAGLLLFIDRTGKRQRLHLRQRDSGLDIVSVEVSEAPLFAADLPDGILRQRVAPLLAPRRLIEQAVLRSRVQVLSVLDADDKTVVRLSIEQHRVDSGAGMKRRPLRDRVVLLPVRGFDDEYDRLREIFEHKLAWDGLRASVIEEALLALGRQPGDYRPKPRVEMDPQMPAGQVARAILSHLFAVIEANEDGVRHDLDSEFLHDLRVAVRRTRTLLGQMKHVLDSPQLRHYRDEFAWLGTMTGPVRDLDVHLLEFPRYVAMAGDGHARDLAPLHGLVRVQRSLARRDLLETLASPRYRGLKKGWRAVLEDADAPCWHEGEGASPVAGVAIGLIGHRQHKVLKQGRRLGEDAPDEAFHELRKECKKLRYLMEFFIDLFPRDEIRPLIKALKGLQDNLGEYQDLCVHSQGLENFRAQLEGEGRWNEASARALGHVLQRMAERKLTVHREFAAAFAAFDEVSSHTRLQDEPMPLPKKASA